MYTIKEAASRAGVSIPVMRAWQRRYQIVDPARTAAGYRLYGDDEVALLRAMRRLVDAGWSPSAAAASLLRDGLPDGPAPSSDPGATVPPSPMGAADGASEGAPELIDRFVAAAASLDAGRVSTVLDEMLSRASFERAAMTMVLPALRRLGEAWAEGRVTVAAEHAASHAVLRRLAAAFEAAGTPRATEGAIVVGLPPGSRHELGSLIFAVAARRAGLPVLYVGADLPAEGWLSATTSAAAAVIGVTTTDDLGPARTVAARLKKERPSMIVALGGPAAQALPGTLQLPEDLPAAVGRLAEAVRARNERSSLSG